VVGGQWLVVGGQWSVVSGQWSVTPRAYSTGEHTSYNFQGFMEGGAESGQRAAQEVIAVSSASGQASENPLVMGFSPTRVNSHKVDLSKWVSNDRVFDLLATDH